MVNGKNYDQTKRLFLTKKYDLAFGMWINDTKNTAIGYALDAECVNSTFLPRSKAFYSYDLNEIAIEINAYNCPAVFFTENFQLKQNSKMNYLMLRFDFKNYENLNFNVLAKLNLNRRLGNGCSSNLTFHKKDNLLFNFLNDENYYDSNELFYRSRFEKFWIKITRNMAIFISTIILILVIIIFCLLVIYSCFKKLIVQAKNKLNITKKNTFEFTNLSNSKNTVYDAENSKSNDECENDSKLTQTNNEITQNSLKKQDETTENSISEFQILRNQLMSKVKTEESFEKVHGLDGNLTKNVIFQS
ncbi:unnamed protein product [Brachionus calyciflorus]|uniref:Uncharacterized protein n=1 Tax=Brachionus calyciflorus TaxID=104777 RepID=A0A813T4I3_9BILA|nr:unnamed protein product [Brachionus calyciflorus]